MSPRDNRATLGTCLAITGGALLLLDLWQTLHLPKGVGAAPSTSRSRDPRLRLFPRGLATGNATEGGGR
jgi:hypothetical protein